MRRLAVFARPPVPGRVKTRLSPALPPALACRLYEAMLADALAAARHASADERVLYWAEATELAAPAGFRVRIQSGEDLGERLEAAFGELLAGGAHAVILGADCPRLDAARLDAAFAALEEHDVALGAADDGGYDLMGLARPAPRLLRDIPWSTARVREVTLERAREAGLNVATLPPLEDLDTPADLARWIASAATDPALPPLVTVNALRALSLLPPAR